MTNDSLALSERAQTARADIRRASHRLAVLLVELVDDGHLRHLGYASLPHYAAKVLDLPAREARSLYRLGRAFPTMPALASAMESGALDWTKAREILRVSTPGTEADWVARAQERTSRELEREVSATPFGAPPPEAGAPLVPESQRGRLSLDGERSDIDTIRRAIAAYRARCGLDTEELDDCALLALLAMASIRAEEDASRGEAGAPFDRSTSAEESAFNDDSGSHPSAPEARGALTTNVAPPSAACGVGNGDPGLLSADGATERGRSSAASAISAAWKTSSTWAISAPPSSGSSLRQAASPVWRDPGERYRVVIEHCPECGRSVSRGAEVSEAVLGQARCDHERVNAVEGPDQGRATRAIPPRLRRMVFVRANWRCEVPGCTNHLWLEVHHFTFVANGGKHVWWNLGVLCGAHHRAVHEGSLSLVRLPSGAIRATHRDGRTYTGPEPTTHVGRKAS